MPSLTSSFDAPLSVAQDVIKEIGPQISCVGPIRSTSETGRSGQTEVTFETDDPPHVPYFPIARFVLMRGARRDLEHATQTLRAHIKGGSAAPMPGRRRLLTPPVPFDQQQVNLVATVCAMMLVSYFGGSLFTQFVDPIADSFGQSNRALGYALAATRVGIIFSLFAGVFADRRGRRRILLISVAGVTLGNAISMVAPNMFTFTLGQVLTRGFINAVVTIGSICIVEEAPAGARAYALGLLTLVGGTGYALGVALIPIGDFGPQAWRFAFVISVASIVFLPGFARHLRETRRYHDLAERTKKRGGTREVIDERYGWRFGVLAVSAFVLNLFAAPSSQFTNRYLSDERGLSGLDITAMRTITQGLPGLFGVAIGGQLAEARGRRPVASIALLIATGAEMAFFLTAGAPLWIASLFAVLLAGISGPALAAFSNELFPTEVRGTANGLLLIAGLAGSATGLVVVGTLADRWDNLGGAIALMGIGSLLAAAFLIPLLPEAKGRTLEEISPSEV